MVPHCVKIVNRLQEYFSKDFPRLECVQKRKFKIGRKTTIDAPVQLLSKLNMLCHTIETDNGIDLCLYHWTMLSAPGARRCCILSPGHLTWEMQIKALVLDKWMIAGLDTIMKQLRNTNDLLCCARLAFIQPRQQINTKNIYQRPAQNIFSVMVDMNTTQLAIHSHLQDTNTMTVKQVQDAGLWLVHWLSRDQILASDWSWQSNKCKMTREQTTFSTSICNY